MQLRGFGLCSDQDGNVRVGVFPSGEEILVGAISFGGVTLQGVRASDAEMSQGANRSVSDNTSVIQDFLKFGGSGASLTRGLLQVARRRQL
jgi:hypothetical protein